MQGEIGLFLSKFERLKRQINNSPKTLSWLAKESEDLQDLCYGLKCNYDAIAKFLSKKGFKHTFITVAFENQYKEYAGNYQALVSKAAEPAEKRSRKLLEDSLRKLEENWEKDGKTKEDYRNFLNNFLSEYSESPFDPTKDEPSALIEGILDDANLLDVTMSDIDEEWTERYKKAWGAWKFFTETLGLDFSGINKRWLSAPELFVLPHIAQTDNSPIVELYSEAVKAYASGCKIASVAMCRALMEYILKNHYINVQEEKLGKIIAIAEARFPGLKKLRMREKKKISDDILHNYESGRNIEDRAVISYLLTLKMLVLDVPKKIK
ncbi:MAG: hypothetical protein ACLPT6_01055 [Desulfobaccales bacterium]